MKTFVILSRLVREKYKKELPMIAALCKLPQREDVALHIGKYLQYKDEMLSKC